MVVVLLPGLAGVSGLVSDSRVIVIVAVLAWLLGLVEVIGEFVLQKRRDDMFTRTVTDGTQKAELLRSITIHEAVRDGQLSSDGIVKLLEPDTTANGSSAATAASNGSSALAPPLQG